MLLKIKKKIPKDEIEKIDNYQKRKENRVKDILKSHLGKNLYFEFLWQINAVRKDNVVL